MFGRCGTCILLMLAASVAGCIGDGGSEAVPETAGSAARDDVAGADGNGTEFRFSPREAGHVTTWANGTVPAYHECPPPCYINVTDITNRIPSEVPVRLMVVLKWDDAAMASGFVRVLRGEAAVFYDGNATVTDQQYVVRELMLRNGATVEVYVEQALPHPTGLTYTLQIVVEWYPSVIPSGVPVAFDALAGATLNITSSGEDAVEALVYGPQKVPMARLAGQGPVAFTPPEAGRYILLTETGGGNLTISGNATGPTTITPMRFATTASEQPFAAARGVPYTWSFQADEVPVRVGVSLISPRPADVGAAQWQILVESPAGVVADRQSSCDSVCTVGLISIAAASERGHPELVAGTYTATYTPSIAEAGLAYHFVETIAPV